MKPTSKPDGGTAVSYVTIEEDAKQKSKQDKKNKVERKKEKEKMASAAAVATNGDTNHVGKSSEEGGQKVPKDLSHIQCFRCKEFGHYSTSKDCPLHGKKEGQKQGIVNGTWGSFQEYLEAGMFMTIMEDKEQQGSVYMTKGLLPMKILLDNQANISIVNPQLLKNVQECDHQVKLKGVGGTQLIVNKLGDLEGFFEVYASEHTTANVICFADVEDKYDITYHKGMSFTVKVAGGTTVEFVCRNKLYVADWSQTGLYMCATVKESKYTHKRRCVGQRWHMN